MTDIQLVQNVKENNCSDSLQELVTRHSYIFFKMLSKYCEMIYKSGKSPADIEEQKMTIIYDSCRSFNLEKKTKFSTWLAHQVRFVCLNFINRNKPLASLDSMPENLKSKLIVLDDKKLVAEEKIMEMLEAHEDKNEALVCKMRYFYDTPRRPSWKCIASQLNMNDKQVMKIHNKALKSLRKKI